MDLTRLTEQVQDLTKQLEESEQRLKQLKQAIEIEHFHILSHSKYLATHIHPVRATWEPSAN